ncbi:MAG: fasciclin domain-containing protein, partial [Bacteroidetes bacterium]|nr:fasciclin domain-containing protein [Bacteroidota bacterium]
MKVSGISDIDTGELKKIIFYHLYNKAYGSGFFTSGSLGSMTLEGDFIQMDISKGVKNTVLNASTKVDSMDIPVTNGIIHVIDDVLEPPTQTLYEWLKQQPQYSIMVEAFEKTGNDTAILKKMDYNTNILNFGKPVVKWRTVFIEPNSVLANVGINSFDDLARKYSNTYKTTKDYSNPSDSLNLFLRYHCMERKFFLSDFTNDYFETFAKNKYLIFSTKPGLSINVFRKKKTPVYNPATQVTDTVLTDIPHVTMALDQSNRITRNGIVHSIDSVLTVYTPPAVLLDIRFAGQPEDRMISLPNGDNVNLTDNIQNWVNDPESQQSVWWLKWEGGMLNARILSGYPAYIFAGQYALVVGSNTSSYSIELTTKPVFPGTYEIWIVMQQWIDPGADTFVQYYWDGEKLGDLISFRSRSDAFGHSICGTGCRNMRQLGVKKFTEMAPHKFKLYVPSPNTKYIAWYSLELRPIK